MSIQSEINRITNKRDASFVEITAKGVTVPSGSTIDDLPDLIAQIPSSSGSGVVLTGEIGSSGGKTLYINGVAQESFSPDGHGGTVDNIDATVLLDISDDAIASNTLKSGVTAHDSMGRAIVGTLNVSEPVLGTKTITANGTYAALSDNYDGYSSVVVQVPTGGDAPELQSKSVAPTESEQTVSPDTGYDGLSSVIVGAISSTYVGSEVARKSSSDLTASGATVSVPAGYYANAASKAIASGSASTPATAITANPEITVSSSGLITATASASKSITPSVSAGYVSSGTAGTVSVSGSNTSQLSTQAAATITPTKSTQTVGGAGKYMTGAITVNPIPANYITTADANAAAGDIVSGKTAYVNGSKVTGTLVIQHYYTGSSDPSSSLGVDGDIYIQE